MEDSLSGIVRAITGLVCDLVNTHLLTIVGAVLGGLVAVLLFLAEGAR
jgi:hypothetical protein